MCPAPRNQSNSTEDPETQGQVARIPTGWLALGVRGCEGVRHVQGDEQAVPGRRASGAGARQWREVGAVVGREDGQKGRLGAL